MNTPIKREDIRKGDRIKLTRTDEFTATHDGPDMLAASDHTYELIERPVTLPTVPGVYLDKQGDVWRLKASRFLCLSIEGFDDAPNEYAPFTLLRPVAEVAAEVLDELDLDVSLAEERWHERSYSTTELRATFAKFGAAK